MMRATPGRRRLLRVVACVAAVGCFRCSLLAPTDDELRGSGPRDAGLGEASAGDAMVDGGGGFNAFDAAAFWLTFDTSAWSAPVKDFQGGAFDGRFVYFAPASSGLVVRYDTGGSFKAPDSWAVFDTTTLDASAHGFHGAAFDGRYVYLVPYGDGYGDRVARFDTQARAFDDRNAWAVFPTNSVNEGAEGFESAVFDGRYLYFVPHRNEFASFDGVVARYDTQKDFRAPASWSIVDTTPFDTYANGFNGGVYDGRFLYLVPFDNGGPDGEVTRLDTTRDFQAKASWEFFPVKTLKAGAGPFLGGAFDGRYVYLAPSSTASSSVMRYDIHGAFAASWSAFDLGSAGLGGKFAGGAFDGRFVYFVPYEAARAVRFDTQATFASAPAWESFDTTKFGAGSFAGAIFDGRFLYYAPSKGGVVARFEARTAASRVALPAHFGSFY